MIVGYILPFHICLVGDFWSLFEDHRGTELMAINDLGGRSGCEGERIAALAEG